MQFIEVVLYSGMLRNASHSSHFPLRMLSAECIMEKSAEGEIRTPVGRPTGFRDRRRKPSLATSARGKIAIVVLFLSIYTAIN